MKSIKSLIMVLLGNVVLAFDVAAFIVPHGIIMGGATGLSLTIHNYLNIDLSLILIFINIVLFIIGVIFLGKNFGIATIISSITYPIFLAFFQAQPFIETLTNDRLMAAIYGGLLLGLGIGIIMKAGASTGGLDIISLVLNKIIHTPVATVMYMADFSVLLAQVVFSDTEQILYGILLTLLTSFVLNYVIIAGKQKVQVFIISNEYAEIKKALLVNLTMGATLVDIENAYSGKKSQAVMVICSSRRLYDVTNLVSQIDENAFTTISQINEVRGKGFTKAR